MLKPKIYATVLVLLFSLHLNAQTNRERDSITKLFYKSHDTVKVQTLITLSRMMEGNNPDSAFIISDSALKIATRIKYLIGVGNAYNHMGSCLTTSGKYDMAITNLIKSLQIFEKLKNKKGITNCYNSIGNAYLGLENYPKAKDYYLKAYKIANEVPKNEGMVAVLSFGIGNILSKENKYKEALVYFKEAEKFFKEKGQKNNEALAATTIAQNYLADSNYVEAKKYFLKVIPVFRELEDEYGLAIALSEMGLIETNAKNYKEAEKYLKESLEINLKRKANDNIQNNAMFLSQLMEKQNKLGPALEYYKLHNQYKDSVINIERNHSIAESESKYESEKKEQELKVKNLELEKSEIQSSQKGKLLYVFAGASLVFIVLLFFVFKQFTEKKKANLLLTTKNEEVERQKSIIEEKNKDITDSINYSKHIQQAIIPSSTKIKSILKESMIFFKPKDIVSGDFYLIEKIDDCIYVAVIDCTGHGVPGALLSVFAYSNIKNIILTSNFKTNPAGILTELCKQFKTSLQSHHAEISVNDGVDISVCILHEKTKKLYFSGAKNNLFQINNEGLKEHRADRWGVSGSNEEKHTEFTNHIIDVKEGEKYFLFTDGFADQFGGMDGKKYKLKQLQVLLQQTHNLSFEKQHDTLDEIFVNWKGNLEQIDDVTIVGFAI